MVICWVPPGFRDACKSRSSDTISLSFPAWLLLSLLQIVSLSNLNPGSVAAARSLIPSLIVFTDDEVGEMLSALRRSSAKYSGLDAAAPGLGQ